MNTWNNWNFLNNFKNKRILKNNIYLINTSITGSFGITKNNNYCNKPKSKSNKNEFKSTEEVDIIEQILYKNF